MNADRPKVIKIQKKQFVYIMLFGMMLIQIATPLHFESIQSAGVWLIFCSSVASFGFTVGKKWTGVNLLLLVSLVITIVLSMLCSSQLSYRSVVVAMCFIEIPLFLGSFANVNSANIRKTVYGCFALLAVYYVVLSFSRLSHVYYGNYGSIIASYLTLGYDNPNETSIHLFSCMIVLVSASYACRQRWKRFIVQVEIIAIMLLILGTQSRTGIVAMVFLIVFVCFFRNRKLPSVVCGLSFMMPLVFIIISLWSVSSNWSLLGDAFDTGRGEIYREVLNNIGIISFLFGDYNFEFQNLHNGFWAVFGTLGFIGVTLFFVFLYKNIRNVWSIVKWDKVSKAALIGLMLLIVNSSTEATYFVGGSSFAAEVIAVYLLCVCNYEECIRKEGHYESTAD